MNSTIVLWRVQTRISIRYKWRNAGLFETRQGAREKAAALRDGIGNRNTRVVRYVKRPTC